MLTLKRADVFFIGRNFPEIYFDLLGTGGCGYFLQMAANRKRQRVSECYETRL